MEASAHHQVVNGWLERVAGRSPQELIRACEAAFAALWQRAHLTLGEVTLGAIVDRVLYTAKERYPWLAPIESTTAGPRCQSLELPTGLGAGEVSGALQFVLTEFLTVLGNLTAEILTPALHGELSNAHRVAAHPIAADRATEAAAP